MPLDESRITPRLFVILYPVIPVTVVGSIQFTRTSESPRLERAIVGVPNGVKLTDSDTAPTISLVAFNALTVKV